MITNILELRTASVFSFASCCYLLSVHLSQKLKILGPLFVITLGDSVRLFRVLVLCYESILERYDIIFQISFFWTHIFKIRLGSSLFGFFT